jgi:hypothetical protein
MKNASGNKNIRRSNVGADLVSLAERKRKKSIDYRIIPETIAVKSKARMKNSGVCCKYQKQKMRKMKDSIKNKEN